jgi:capsular polysaccharide biosynthesis protein
MSTVNNSEFQNTDLSVISQAKENPVSKASNKKSYIIIGIIVALAAITTIVLFIVLLRKKTKNLQKK